MWTDEKLIDVTTFDIADGQIRGIHNILNPDKLAYITRQLQARL